MNWHWLTKGDRLLWLLPALVYIACWLIAGLLFWTGVLHP